MCCFVCSTWPSSACKTTTDKDIDILALRHQLAVLQRQTTTPRLTPSDRAFLAALLHRFPRSTLRRLHLIVSPDTVLRWHRDLLRRHHARTSRPKRPGRPRTLRSIRGLVLRLASENSSWGYRRIHGELAGLGITTAPSTVWQILNDHGIEPSPQRDRQTWATLPMSPSARHPRRRLRRNQDAHRHQALCPSRHRARRPPHPDPRRHCSPRVGLEHPDGKEPGHGPAGC